MLRFLRSPTFVSHTPVTHEGGRLVITVEDTGTGRAAPMIALTDRVGALGGSVLTQPTACQAEIPCALS